MKRVLAIVGSPRKPGNCEIMVKEISRRIDVPHELRLLHLPDFEISGCRGCYACLFGDGGCVLDDDFPLVVDEILAADAYVVAVPTYFLGPVSGLKRLTDRGLALYSHAEKLWGRPAVGVSVTGIEGREGYTELGLESFLKLLLAEIKATRVVYGALPGEIFRGEENREAAGELAAALFGAKGEEEGPVCPVCGGRTFRFLTGGRVRCMLCSNAGPVAAEDGMVCFDVSSGPHELFTSLEAVIEHREWLKGMKERFLAERAELKEITRPYREEGTPVRKPE